MGRLLIVKGANLNSVDILSYNITTFYLNQRNFNLKNRTPLFIAQHHRLLGGGGNSPKMEKLLEEYGAYSPSRIHL